MRKLTALIIDDEANNRESLAFMLETDCNGIVVAGRAANANDARNWLKKNHADVVFLDISMPGEDGFDFLSSIEAYDFKVVFVTAYDQYAIQAIKRSAVDYLLKPVNVDELIATVNKLHTDTSTSRSQINNLIQSMKAPVNSKIALPQLGGIVFADVTDIVSLQADSNYTIIHMKDMQKMVVTKTLKDFEELLDSTHFCRIHKSYIVNLNYIKEYSSIDGGVVKMTDGNQWGVSRRQLENFLEKMGRSSLMFRK